MAWDDPALAIDWPLTTPPQVSAKDASAARFHTAELPD